MKRFFSEFRGNSVLRAKNRLKTVISRDRMNVPDSATADKIRKDIISVLTKYTGGNSEAITVCVKNVSQSLCWLEATVSVDMV